MHSQPCGRFYTLTNLHHNLKSFFGNSECSRFLTEQPKRQSNPGERISNGKSRPSEPRELSSGSWAPMKNHLGFFCGMDTHLSLKRFPSRSIQLPSLLQVLMPRRKTKARTRSALNSRGESMTSRETQILFVIRTLGWRRGRRRSKTAQPPHVAFPLQERRHCHQQLQERLWMNSPKDPRRVQWPLSLVYRTRGFKLWRHQSSSLSQSRRHKQLPLLIRSRSWTRRSMRGNLKRSRVSINWWRTIRSLKKPSLLRMRNSLVPSRRSSRCFRIKARRDTGSLPFETRRLLMRMATLWNRKTSCRGHMDAKPEFKSLPLWMSLAKHFHSSIHDADVRMNNGYDDATVSLWCQRRSTRELQQRHNGWGNLHCQTMETTWAHRMCQGQSPSSSGSKKMQERRDLPCHNLQIFQCEGLNPHNPMAGIRIGEAKHPGPDEVELIVTTLNPTAINDKEYLLAEFGSQIYMLAETSATSWVQMNATKRLARQGFHSIWGHPAPLQRAQTAEVGSCHQTRGAAVGVSIHATLPLIASKQDHTSEWYGAGRLVRAYVRVGQVDVQLITLYGIAKGNQGARSRTNALLQEAANLAHQTNLPTIIAGDLNHDPQDLEVWKLMWQHGWRSSAELHLRLHGMQLPATYQRSTAPDVLLFNQLTVPWIHKIHVDQSGYVGHHPLSAQLCIPTTSPLLQKWRRPTSWLLFEPDEHDFAKQYLRQSDITHQLSSVKTAPSLALRSWSQKVEDAIDRALHEQHARDPMKQPFQSLPHHARGRCQLPKLIQTPLQKAIRPAWKGHFTPDIDIGTIKLRQWTRQVRRIQSLKHQTAKLNGNDLARATVLHQLGSEWNAILKAPGFQPSFPKWLQRYPEFELPGIGLPNEAQLHDMEQILIFETKHLAYTEKLQKQNKKFFAKWMDRWHGGKKQAFGVVREPSLGILNQVEQMITTDASWSEYEGKGLLTLTVDTDEIWRPELPLLLDHQETTLISYVFPRLEVMLHDAEQPPPTKCKVLQRVPTAEPEQVGRALSAFWQKYWRRETYHEQHDISSWTEFDHLFEQMPIAETMNIQMQDVELWKESISTLKSKSARGLCGWFPDELKFILCSDAAIDELVQILAHIECFPTWLMQANIVPVKKFEDASAPSQIRPITILPLLYRLWARATSRKALQFWGTNWPVSISGFLPHRHPEHLVYHLQHRLELIHTGNSTEELGGVTLDLIKCFNQLPQQPALQLLVKLGIPKFIADCWFQSIAGMSRWWMLRGTIFPAGLGTTGVAEGDPWSVCVMLAVNKLWTFHIAHDTLSANSYADNWSYAASSPQIHKRAVRTTIMVTKALRVEIDWGKTWAWATSEAHLQALQHAVEKYLPPDVNLQKVPHARELGYILHYRQRQFRGTQKQRHQQALRRLHALEKCDLDLNTTALVGHQSATVKALFGVHIYVPAQKYFNELRTALAQCLVKGANTNPFLANTILAKSSQDPELYAIQQALRAARRYLHNIDDSARITFFHLAAKPPREAQYITGPAQALSHYLRRVGWQLNRQGELLVDGFLSLSLMTADWRTIQRYLQRDWMAKVQDELVRPVWRKAGVIDAQATIAELSKFPDSDQKLLAREILSAYQTQHQKTHYDDTITDLCVLCGEEDSVEHRVLWCEQMKSIRNKYENILQMLQERNPLHVNLPVIFEEPDYCLHRVIFHAPLELAWQPFAVSEKHPPRFYTDGSCKFPHEPNHRWASFSIVWEDPEALNWSHDNLMQLKPLEIPFLKVVAVGSCPGLQSIPRAELEAVIQVILQYPDAEINTDSMYAIKAVNLVRNCSVLSQILFFPNFDQLERLFQHFASTPQRPVLRKVKAHRKFSTDMNSQEMRDFYGNFQADHAANVAAENLARPWKASLRAHAEERTQERLHLRDHWNMRLEICKVRTMMLKEQQNAEVSGTSAEKLRLELSNWIVQPPGKCLDLANRQDKILFASPWGFEFTSLLWQWMRSLVWPQQPAERTPRAPIGISWIELGLNFVVCTTRTIPVNVSGKYGTYDYRAVETHQSFCLNDTNMWRMIDSFRRAISFLEKMHEQQVFPMNHSTSVRSLYLQVGYGYTGGLAIRPQMLRTRDTLNALYSWLAKPDPLPYPEWPNIEPLYQPFELPSEFNQMNRQDVYKEVMREKRARASRQ